jgi:hypothetical protein
MNISIWREPRKCLQKINGGFAAWNGVLFLSH